MRTMTRRQAGPSSRAHDRPPEDERGKSEHKEEHRDLIEFLNELRVILPGVQVLFAFLLVVPFSEGFKTITQAQEWIFFGAFVCTAVSCILLMAPSAYHRLGWRRNHTEALLRFSNRLVVIGLGFLTAAIAGTIFLITAVIID